MKNQILGLFCLALVFCTGSLVAQNIAPFSIAEYEQTIPAFADKPVFNANMEISLLLADTKNVKLAKLIYSVLYEGLTPQQYADKRINKEKSEYHEAMAEYPEMASFAAGNWIYSEEHLIVIKGSYAIITKTIYVYYGGAHGNTVIQHFVINTKTPEYILLDEIVAGTNISKLKDMVKRELKAYLESIDFYDEEYYSDRFVINNYYPTKDGLRFAWSPYEVAPYAVGLVEVVITWKEAESLLNSRGRALAGAFK